MLKSTMKNIKNMYNFNFLFLIFYNKILYFKILYFIIF